MRIHFEILGLQELRERFDPARARMIVQSALRKAMQPAVTAVIASAPRKTGKMASSISLRVGSRQGSALSARIVTAVGYGHLVERGHRMVIGGRAMRAKTALGRLAEARSGRFTGRVIGTVPAHPFARPAAEASLPAVEVILHDEIATALNAP